MIPILLLFLAILGGVLLLAFLYFLSVSASEAAAKVPENRKKTETDPVQSGARNTGKEESMRAVIRCAYCPPEVAVRFRAEGYTDCNTLNMVFGGNLSCGKGCIGLGSCAIICPNDAFVFMKGRMYISDACNGCGYCVHACPKKLIELVPVSDLSSIKCAAYGSASMPASCHAALEPNGGVIDYRKFPVSGFKILHKWGILGQKSRQE
jgi:ferredoxin